MYHPAHHLLRPTTEPARLEHHPLRGYLRASVAARVRAERAAALTPSLRDRMRAAVRVAV